MLSSATPTSRFTANLAELQSQTFDILLGAGFGGSGSSAAPSMASFSTLLGGLMNPTAGATGVSALQALAPSSGTLPQAAGRNMQLNDPESAFQMMSVINRREVDWKAEFAELKELDAAIDAIGASTGTMTESDTQTDAASGRAKLGSFVERYNALMERFRPDVQTGGPLEGSQAARIAMHELEASVRNIFNGAEGGIHGLYDLGIDVEPGSHKLSFNAARFDASYAANPSGVDRALNDFGQNFASAARVAAGDGQFIDRRLDNLDRALDYLHENLAALREEFGTGDAVRPTGRKAEAAAAYAKMQAA